MCAQQPNSISLSQQPTSTIDNSQAVEASKRIDQNISAVDKNRNRPPALICSCLKAQLNTIETMKQPLHLSLTSTRRPRGRRRAAPLMLALSSLVSAEDPSCPPGANGWAATSDCRQYYWCSSGATSGMVYTCPDSTEYNVATSVCQNPASFECPGSVTSAPESSAPTGAPGVASQDISPGEQLEAMTTAILGNGTDATPIPVEGGTAPTNYPTKLGPPLYYGDFRTSSCLSAAADPTVIAAGVGVPSWLTEDLMYQSKQECCEDMFGWAPLENCLGDNWVETNYVRGSQSPTMSPSLTPTSAPSGMPSVSFGEFHSLYTRYMSLHQCDRDSNVCLNQMQLRQVLQQW